MLSERQLKKIDLANIAKLVEKVQNQHSALFNQRANPIKSTKLGALDLLIDQIGKASEHRLVSQSYQPTEKKNKQLDLEKLGSLIDKAHSRCDRQVIDS